MLKFPVFLTAYSKHSNPNGSMCRGCTAVSLHIFFFSENTAVVCDCVWSI